MRYWFKLLKMPMSRLSRQAYVMLHNMHENGHQNWVTSIKNILCKNGFGFVWTDHSIVNEKCFIIELRERLKDCFIQQWRGKLDNNDDFQLYCKFKNSFQTEKYLNDLSIRQYKDALVKFRLSVSQILCHKNRFYFSRSNICPLCNLIDEDELHFIFGCNKLEELRCGILPQYCLNNRHSGTLIDLLNKDEYSFVIGKYIFHALKLRDSVLQTI